jgi:Polycystin cation channel
MCVHSQSITLTVALQGMYQAWRDTRNPLTYFTSGWTWVGLASTSLMITSNIVWWTFVLRHVPAFDIDIRYNVYNDLNARAHILRIRDQGEELDRAVAAFSNLQFLVQTLSWYYAINGINILLVIARILNLMHFQPRLGIVTRSLLLAGPDLLHFAVVAGIVFVGYAMMAHVIFGNVIEKFSTFRLSIDTCFEMLLGEIGVNEDLKALTGLQGLAGSLFFWTFELLVFMVLLNFLLAIIVDAFSVVKDNTSESTGLHEELGQMAREKWRAMLGSMLNVHYIPSHRLSALLKHWAGSDLEEAKAKKPEEETCQKKIRVCCTCKPAMSNGRIAC